MFDIKYFIIFILIFILFYLICKKNSKESFITSPFSEYSTNLDNLVYTDTSGNLVSVDKKSLIDFILPKGLIVAWKGGVNPPSGWALCNGLNGTPDLRGRFIFGYNPELGGTYPLEAKGGSEKHTLTIEEMPSHKHTIGGQIHWNSGQTSSGANIRSGGDWGQNNNGDTNNTGGGQPHNNMPPYYVLAYIMKL